MTKTSEEGYIVGLDVGTTGITALVGELLPDGQINLLGVGKSQARGMERGGVNDLDSVAKSIETAIEEARQLANVEIGSVYLSISGKHIGCQNESAKVAISEEVVQSDIDDVIHIARSVVLDEQEEILHVLPQEYAIDLQPGISNPLGLSGVQMKAQVHLVTAHKDMAKNLKKCVQRCGLDVAGMAFSGYASSLAVLTEDEKELGACVVDIGGGTMDIAVYTGGALRYTSVLPYAGRTVTSDVAYAFGTPHNDAEQVKVRFGCARASLVSQDESIEVPSVGGRPARSLHRHTLADVIEPRYSELLGMIRKELGKAQAQLKEAGCKHQIAAGVILTGGAAQIEGLVECASEVLGCQVRIGKPQQLAGLSDFVDTPADATVVGLLLHGRAHQEDHLRDRQRHRAGGSVFQRVSNWFRGEF